MFTDSRLSRPDEPWEFIHGIATRSVASTCEKGFVLAYHVAIISCRVKLDRPSGYCVYRMCKHCRACACKSSASRHFLLVLGEIGARRTTREWLRLAQPLCHSTAFNYHTGKYEYENLHFLTIATVSIPILNVTELELEVSQLYFKFLPLHKKLIQ